MAIDDAEPSWTVLLMLGQARVDASKLPTPGNRRRCTYLREVNFGVGRLQAVHLEF